MTSFNEQDLKNKGFILENGAWRKPSTSFVMDRLEAGKHAKQAGALDDKSKTAQGRKTGGKKRSPKRKATSVRRKQPYKLVVTMTAYLPRYLDDDNLAGALKPVRDELADWMGVDDGDRRILWECDQTLTRGNPGVCVVVREA